ncbi:CPBP family intramembrane metalloprotease [Paenibacillus albidus]|nr:CPBP family intramembrane metalloprotease [Paenibacillus albidus]
MLLASWASDLILLGIFVPIVEELYFRGYLLPS